MLTEVGNDFVKLNGNNHNTNESFVYLTLIICTFLNCFSINHWVVMHRIDGKHSRI
jgi:hypothetical protein